MNDTPLKGRRALVTGSVQGIGLAIAQGLARQGCAIVLHGLATPDQAQEARAAVLEAGAPTVEVLVHDLREAAQVQQMMEAPYVAAKFALVGMSRVAALEYASAGSRESGGVTVNCICPGWTETAIIQPQIDARAQQLGTGREEAIRDLLKEKQPSLRTSLPSEIARLVAWLCDPAAHNLTGTAIPVDGGWTAQ